MLNDIPQPSQPSSRFEGVLAEILQDEEQGRTIDVQRYCESFPELAEPLREFFRNRKQFARLAPAIAPTPSPRAAERRAGPEAETKHHDSSPDAPSAAGPPALGSRLAGYEIEAELGRGGMGIVYRARQLKPERQVALKIIRMDRLESLTVEERRQWLERFQREAQLVASLDQPDHIVTLYEVGEHAGQSYFTMRLVTGGTLAQRLNQIGELDAASAAEQRVRQQRDNARLLATVARAVHYAHQRGILHRDLKPANILLDEHGRPLVSDFGLARRIDQTGSLVASGIEGTASYMSPEQATGAPGATTTASDVYSLGATLYECLTGRPPFKGKNDIETLLQVLHQDVLPPRSLNRRLDRDLETICLKCLQKEPGRRYASAAALADDLDNWLAGRPINARPAGTAERLWRWCRREPIRAGALGFAAVALVAFAIVAGGFAFYRDRAVRDLGKAASDLTDALEKVQEQRNQAASANRQLRLEQRTTGRTTAGLALARGRAAWEAGDPSQGSLWMTWSLTLAPGDDTALHEAIRINMAGWTATLPPPRPPLRHPGIVANVGFSPDGRKIVALSTGSVRLEDKVMPDGRKGRFLVSRPENLGDPFFQEHVFSPIPTVSNLHQPPPRRPVTARGQVFLWDVANSKPVGVKPPLDSQMLAVTPDGKIALTTTREDHVSKPSTAQLWNLAEGKALGEAIQFNYPIRWAVCSGEGKTFVALVSNVLVLWDAATGRRLKDLPVNGHEVHQAALSPDGKVLALLTASPFGVRSGIRQPFMPGMREQGPSGKIALYDLAERQQLVGLPFGWPPHEVDSEAAVAVGPGGRLVLTVSPSDGLRTGTVHLWDREAKKDLPLPYRGRLAFAQFSPDGKLLLTASGRALVDVSEAVQLWDTATGQPRGAPLLPRSAVQTAAFSPDSKLLAIGCGEGEVQLWETATARPLARALRHPGPTYSVAFSPDGSKLVTGGYDGAAYVWDTHPSRIIQPIRLLERVAVVTADGSRYLQRGQGNTLRLHDMTSGQPYGESVPCTEKDRGIALSPDMRTLVIVNEGNMARLWDAVAGKPIGEPLAHVGPVAGIRFSADGRTFLTFVESTLPRTRQPIAYRWDAATGRSLGFEGNPHISLALAISPDGCWALRALGAYAVVVAVSTAKGNAKSMKHNGPIIGALFSPDSRTLLTVASRSGSWEEARLWDVATGDALGPPMPHQGPIRANVFSPDGKMVLTGSDDGTARLWDTATGKQFGPLMSHGGRIRAVAFRPDGKLAATAGDDGTARLWHVATCQPLGPPLPHPAAVSSVLFGTRGETLITAAGDSVRVWKIPQAIPGDAKRLLLEAEIETGMELDGGTPRLLDDEERARRKQLLKEAEKAHND